MIPPGAPNLLPRSGGREFHTAFRLPGRHTAAGARAGARAFQLRPIVSSLGTPGGTLTPDVRNLLRHLRVPGLAYRDFRAAAPASIRRSDQRQGLVTVGLVSLVPSVGRTVLCANLARAFAQAGARAGIVDVDPRG